MISHCSPGDKAWLVSNRIFVQEVTIGKASGGFVLIKFEAGGGIRVRPDRLYATKEEADAVVEKNKAEDTVQEKKQTKEGIPDYLRAMMM